MPIQVQGPDGATIEFPDGTPEATMEAALQAHYSKPKAAQSNLSLAPSSNNLGAPPPSLADLSQRDHRGVQIGGEFSETMPAWKNAAYGLVSPVASAIVGAGQMTGLMDNQTAKESLARIDAVRSRTPGRVSGFAGDMGMFALVPEAKLANAGRLAKLGQAAVQGGALGALQGTREGESRTTNAGLGALFNVAGQGASDALQTVGKKAASAITDEARALWETAKAHGITLTPAQLSNSSFVRTMSSALNKLPFSGGASVMKRQQAGFNEAVSGSFGEKASKLTDEVMANAKTKLGQAYDSIFGRNSVKLDDEAMTRLANIQHEASNLTPEHAAVVNKQIDDLLGMSKDGVIPGKAYQTFRVDRLKKLEQSAQNSEPFKAGLIRDIRQTIEDAANRSITGNDAAALKLTNQQYSNMKVAQKALKQVAGAGGDVRPSSLWNIVNQRHGSTKDMRELARLGQGMKDPIPDSGTAQRQLAYHLLALGGGGYAATSDNPLIRDIGLLAAGGAVGGRAVNSKTLAKLMMREGRGKLPQYLAPYARPALAALLMPESERNP